MKTEELFQVALSLTPPWYVHKITFDPERQVLDIELNFEPGAQFPCPVCGSEGCKVYDSSQKTWRHLNFFQHECYLHARLPRVRCGHCGVKTLNVPWARPGSGFTLLFEAFILQLAKEMPVNAVARLIGEHDTRIWRVIDHYVQEARTREDFSKVRKVGIDETSSKRGHNYITVFVDLDRRKVIFVAPGKDSQTVKAFRDDLRAHGGKTENIVEVCCDMSSAYISGVSETFPDAELTFDKFHVVKILNDAVDQVRRQEQKERPELKGSRFLWLKNEIHLTPKQKELREALSMKRLHLKTARAYRIKLAFQQFYEQPLEHAEEYLKRWFFWATHSRLEPIIKAAYTIKNHWQGILRWFRSRVTNGILEAINGLIQAAKRKARGYRNSQNLITMVYLIAGKLDLAIHLK
ncbi:Transposase [Desulfacinum infernum DSM 9756]|uniref:Transposase n=1 Tax=Desulfacinum infernum DSM 9756 TaxID=1121391 RepID=A0A1M5H094_9BACT|nr:ISL3 family transposase [Desulfacinum infernum]SHF00093.1 Transposase [Desulfacinum infernum DSM 9756]SHG09348.1 Transposase [Desulfacinum infernum DSM 9756]SHG20006.1 Transposase [Desulfacinum infernum DSM 9756]SHG25122.1 Transposase [Desulfacinum infernum DSM 9756]